MKKNQKYRQQNKNIIKKNSLNTTKIRNWLIIYVIIVFIVPILLYLQTTNFEFVHFDDNKIILNNITFLSHFKNAQQVFLTEATFNNSGVLYRPLQTLSYMIDIQFSGVNEKWMFHLSNILLLASISCLLFLLLKKFLIPPNLALFGTLIYCVNPLFVSSVAWIPARGDLQLTFFSIVSFLFLIEFLSKDKIVYLFLHWITFTVALFCKETAALLPLLFIIYYFTFHYNKHIKKKYLFNILLYAISGIFWLWLHTKAVGSISNKNDGLGLVAIISNLKVIPESLTKFFFPFDNNPFPVFSVLKTLVGISIIIIIIIIFFRNKERSKKEKIFCFCWFIFLILPPMLIKQINFDYLDHRFLLPLIGILLFVLFSFPKKWIEKGAVKKYWLMVAIFVFLSSFTFIKSRSYSDPMTFYSSAIAHNSNSFLAYNNRGLIKSDRSDFLGAIGDYNNAIAINPNEAEAYNNRGNAKVNIGDKLGATDDYNKAIAISPNYAEAFNNRGFIKANMNDQVGAIADYSKAIAINPNYAVAYNNKGAAMGSIGNLHDAIINFNKAIEIKPDYSEAYYDRAITKYFLKDLTGTIEDCEKALMLNPNIKNAITLKAKAQQELQNKKVVN